MARCVTAGHGKRIDFETETFVAHALRADGFDASEDGTGRGTPLVPVPQGVALRGREGGATAEMTGDVMTALRTSGCGADKPHVLAPIAFDETQITSADNRSNPQPGDACHPLARGARPPTLAFHARHDPDSGPVTHPLDTDGCSIGIMQAWRVRRLMPVECERLQGFPDDYTAVPFRGKRAADGPRYKALGNSMAVNVMRWLGQRIAMADGLTNVSLDAACKSP